jgi:hypothetical protein
MGKLTRSPLLGYNHNVRYGGRILHVQTEDSGPSNPHLFTHLFFEGSILATKRFQYDAAATEDGVRGMMQGQHKEILKELKQGLFDDRLEDFFAARGDVFTSPHQADAEAAPVLFATETVAPSTYADAPQPRAAQFEAPPSPAPEILDLDSIPTPPPYRMQTPEPLPVHAIRPTLPGRGAYTFKRPTRDIATADPNETGTDGRRSPRTPAPSSPASPVVVQRRIVVGAGAKKPGAARPVAPRPRRPGGGIPYVVQEGSHPNLIVRRQSEAGVPPATPMDERADAAAAPRTAAPPPIPQEPPAESLVSTRSLDDVILAYLSKSDQRK